MTKYEQLLSEYGHLDIKEMKMHLKGLYIDDTIWIKKDLLESEKVCILAEELGHYETSSGDILDQKDVIKRRQELVARRWAYNKLIPFEDIINAFSKGYYKPYEIADYLDVDEAFLRECLNHYDLL